MNEKKSRLPITVGTVLAAIIIIISIVWYNSSVYKPAFSFYTVSNGAVTQQIESSGAVQAAQNVNLSFQSPGEIVAVNAQVGDEVTEGEVLAEIDGSTIQAQLAQAQANVTAQQAKLAELEQGARPEEITIQETTVNAAQTTLAQAQKSLIAQIEDAYVASDDAVHNQADQLFNSPHSSNPTLNVQLNNTSLTYQIQSERLALESVMNSWQGSVAELENATSATSTASSTPDLTNYSNQAESNLNSVVSFMNDMAQAVNSLMPGSNLTSTAITGYKTSISIGRTEVTGSVSALVGAEAAYQGDLSALTQAQNGLALDEEGTGTTNDIDAQQAAVQQAEAAVQALQVALSQTTITAPFDGKITVQNAKVGQTSTPGSPVMTMISNTQFQLIAYVAETDVSKIAVDDIANITLDAYGDSVVFPAQVILIDPAETIINNVPSYKVTLQFNQNDSRIQSGMTANINIISQIGAAATLVVPTQSVIDEDNQNYVLAEVSSTSVPQLHVVTVGAEGDNGFTQILSGLQAGDKIVDFGGTSGPRGTSNASSTTSVSSAAVSGTAANSTN